MRRGRVRAWCKWAGAGACALLVALYVCSFFRSLDWAFLHLPRRTAVLVGGGTLIAEHRESAGLPGFIDGYTEELLIRVWRWWPSFHRNSASAFAIVVPLWIPLCIAALPTAYLFYADALRRAPGLCPACRYDRSGLPDGAGCPECGAKAVE